MKKLIKNLLKPSMNEDYVVTNPKAPREIEMLLEAAGLEYSENFICISDEERYYVFSFIDEDGLLQTVEFITQF